MKRLLFALCASMIFIAPSSYAINIPTGNIYTDHRSAHKNDQKATAMTPRNLKNSYIIKSYNRSERMAARRTLFKQKK